jgi:GAF domain-containing protein
MDLTEPDPTTAGLVGVAFTTAQLDAVLGRVTDLAVRAVDGADEASVTVLGHEEAHTAAATGSLARRLDESQYRLGYGPCVEAAAENTTVSATDLATDIRWSQWTAHALAAGVRSSLSVGLCVDDKLIGALNFYARSARAFDDTAIRLARIFAEDTAIALAGLRLYDATRTVADRLQSMSHRRAVIEQAKGIIMSHRRCTAEQAFTVLLQAARESGCRVRDAAALLVDSIPSPAAAGEGMPRH